MQVFSVSFVKFFRTPFSYRTPLALLKTVKSVCRFIVSISSFNLCIVVFTYLSSNMQNRSHVLLQRFSIFRKIFKTLLRLMTEMALMILMRLMTKTEAKKSGSQRGELRWQFTLIEKKYSMKQK